jgi:NAD(P) transhydrogenase
MTCGGTVDQLVDTVFNYPTLSEAYKVAALDAVNKMRAVAQLSNQIPPAIPAQRTPASRTRGKAAAAS